MSGPKLEKLPSAILSSAQLYQVISEFGALVNIKSSAKSKNHELKNLPESTHYFFRKPPTYKQLAELKSQLERIIQTAPVVRLTFSDSPSAAFCQQLADWFRQIHPYCLVEIIVDGSIIGGVIIRSGRRIFDHSIRTQLGEAENSLTGILADA